MNQFEIASLALNFAVLALCYVLNKRTNATSFSTGEAKGRREGYDAASQRAEDIAAVDRVQASWAQMDKQPRKKNGQYATKHVELTRDHGIVKRKQE